MTKTTCLLLAAMMLLPRPTIRLAGAQHMPGSHQTAVAVPAKADPFNSSGVYNVPFEFNIVDHPFITVQVSVNGSKPHPFVVDTACDCSLAVFDWAKEECKLALTGPEFRMSPGTTRGRFAKGCDIEFSEQIGTHSLVHFDEPMVFSFPYLSDALRPRPAGIIGAQVFEVATTRLDFDTNRFSLFSAPHDTIEAAANAQRLPLISEVHGKLLSVTLDTKVLKPLTFRIDTGSLPTIIPKEAPLKATTLSERPNRISDLAGSVVVRGVLLDEMQIGTADVRLPTLMVQARADPIILGLGILSQFRVTMDPQHGELILEPRTRFDRRREGDIGFTTNSNLGKLVVDRVYSPIAERSEIRRGDEVLSMDGSSEADVVSDRISESELAWRINGREGAVAKLVILRDGKQLELEVLRTGFPDTVPQVLGFNLLKHKDKPARVLEVERGTPADAAGIKPGDEITAVNGESILAWTSFKTILEMLDVHGKPTVTSLQLKRKSDGKTVEFRMEGGKLIELK